ncbi:hypothetical protein AVEN_112027-1 [Araneus ventricosus]|uniref:Uncharacterized protein n=1 Tax=Araneus ventricosus TaxID=182803 RepID=A0A4Y2QQR2_ARAVE|nr:hypothetical protein AVEN_112027-1 [Araneus ventricosus]
MWRDVWTQCFEVIKDYPTADLKKSHRIVGQWMSIMNQYLDFPIRDIAERYNFVYFYNEDSTGPKEIIHLYFDENQSADGKTNVYIIFHLTEFRKIHRNYCTNYTKNNHMLVDESRGTINMSAYYDAGGTNPSHYFLNLMTWYFYWIFLLHAMAHLEVYDKYDHAQYDTHGHIKDSRFFKIHFYGQVIVGR